MKSEKGNARSPKTPNEAEYRPYITDDGENQRPVEYPGGEIPNGNGARCHVASITVLSERIGIRERLRWHRQRQHGELSRRQATAYSSSQIIPDVSKTDQTVWKRSGE